MVTSYFRSFYQAFGELFEMYFGTDTEVMSKETQQILSNPKDREEFLKAVKEIKDKPPGEEKKVKLSTGEITLVS